MSITVVSSAENNWCTSLETARREIGTTVVADDKILSDYIKQASDYIESYTGRRFAKETVTETFAGKNQIKIVLERRPVGAISAISFDGSTVSTTTYTVDDADAGILHRPTGWTSSRIFYSDIERHPTGEGKRDWSISYVGGYDMPTTTGTRNFPYELERAALDLIKVWYHGKGTNPLVRSERTGDAQASYWGGETQGISPSTLSILDRYRRCDF